jgi:hypothetical protein
MGELILELVEAPPGTRTEDPSRPARLGPAIAFMTPGPGAITV